jgi:hypothetical protein
MTLKGALIVVLLAAGIGRGADPPVEKLTVRPRLDYWSGWTPPAGTPTEQVKAITDRQKQLQDDFFKRYKAAKTQAEQSAIAGAEYPEPIVPGNLLLEIAKDHPRDPAAFDALLWVARNMPRTPNQPEAPAAVAANILMRDFSRHARIGEFCRVLTYEDHHLPSVEFVKEVYEKHPEATARALAGLTRANHLRRNAGFANSLTKANPQMQASFVRAYGKEFVDYLAKVDVDQLNREAEAILDKLVSDKELAKATFVRGDKTKTVGEAADAELFEMRHLLPGKPVPEVAGEDIDGKAFKLSDYRGKVVLLDFWGDW